MLSAPGVRLFGRAPWAIPRLILQTVPRADSSRTPWAFSNEPQSPKGFAGLLLVVL